MNYDREKFIEAILFFAKHTSPKRYGILKAMKLLYFSDLEHLKRYHRTITGDQYVRIQNGPVPTKSYAIISEISPTSRRRVETDPELLSAMEIESTPTQRGDQYRIIPRRDYNPEIFSDSDIEVMGEIAEIWKDADADQIREGSYEWSSKNLGVDLRRLSIGESIQHTLILPPEERRLIEESEKEDRELEELLRL